MIRIFQWVFCCCLALLMVACGGGTSDVEYIARAQALIANKDVPAATIELKNALQVNSGNAQARRLLGQIYFDTGDLNSAKKELNKSFEFGEPAEAVLPVLSQVLVQLRELDAVEGLATVDLGPEATASVLASKGLAFLYKGDDALAKITLAEALDLDSGSAYVLYAQAVYLRAAARGIYAKTRAQIDQVFAIDAQYAPAWNLLGAIEQRESNLEAAEQAYSNAIKYSMDDSRSRYRRALIRIEMQHYDEAQKDVSRLLGYDGDSPAYNYAQGLLLFRNNDMTAAQEAFLVALRAEKALPRALFYSAYAAYRLEQLESAESLIGRYLAVRPTSVEGRKLMAVLLGRQELYVEVEEILRPVLAFVDDDITAMNLLAGALLAQGKTDEGIELLERVAQLQGGSAAAQLRLAKELIRADRVDVGVERSLAVLEFDPDNEQANLVVVMHYLNERKYEQAEKLAKEYLARNPTEIGPHNLLGLSYLAAGNESDAITLFEQVLELAPGDPLASRKLNEVAMRDGDFARARAYHEAVLAHNKDYLPVLLLLANLDAIEGNEAGMVSRLQYTIEAHPDRLEPRLILGRYYLTRSEMEKLSALLSNLNDTMQDSPGMLALTAMSELNQKNYSAALDHLQKLNAQKPGRPSTVYSLAQAYFGLGDVAQAENYLLESIELEPKNVAARIVLARIYLDQGRTADLEVQTEFLVKHAPDTPAVLALQSDIAWRAGDKAQALEYAERAFAGAKNTSTLLALSRRMQHSGDIAAAQQLRKQWISEHPQDHAVRIALAEAYLSQGQSEPANEQYEYILKTNPNNPIALNNLANSLRDADPDRALSYAEHAAELQPKSASILDTLAMVLSVSGEGERAQRTLEKALEIDGDNPTFLYHSALIAAQNGDKKQAIKTLSALNAKQVTYPELDDAARLLDQLQR